MPEVAVLIPAYNEEENIEAVIKRTRQINPHLKILVVDDGSHDKTSQLAKKAGADVVIHKKNKGKAEAIRTGMNILKKYKWVVFLDADLQYSPEELKKFLNAIRRGNADFILGYRDFSQIPHFRHWFANNVVSSIFNICYSSDIRDLMCGLRAIRASLWMRMNLIFSGYLVETEMAYEVKILGAKTEQVNVGVKYHSKSGLERGIKIVFSIILHIIFWKIFGKRYILFFK